MPKLSIIVTAYNIEAYIAACLECLTNQTLTDIEIIAVDDGSSDRTADIISDFALRDERIKTIRFDKNSIGGVATAANAGLDVASGEFVGFADGDDIYDLTMFEKLYSEAVAHSADLAMCGYSLLDESTGHLSDPADSHRWHAYRDITPLNLDDTVRREMLRFVAVPWRKIYRRDLVARVNLRFPVGDYFYEDNPVHWAAVLAAERIVLIPEKLCQHRVGRHGQTMSTADSRLLRIFQHHDNIQKWLAALGKEEEFRQDLLVWTANQLAWVSKRVEGPLKRELYDVLRPVISRYDQSCLDSFGMLNGKGPTFLMLQAVKAGDWAAFSRVISGKMQQQSVLIDSHSGSARLKALIARGLFHLRHSGVRETGRMTRKYALDRLRSRAKKTGQAGSESKNGITNEDLIASLAILQLDIRRLKAELVLVRQQTATLDTGGPVVSDQAVAAGESGDTYRIVSGLHEVNSSRREAV